MRERAIILAVIGLFAVGFQFGAVAGPAKRQAAPPVDPLSAFDIAPLAPLAPSLPKFPRPTPSPIIRPHSPRSGRSTMPRPRAADQGWDVAQERLGALYEAGYGVPKDSVQAHMWLNLAASRVRDSYLRGAYAKARNDLAFKMTTDQVTQAQRLARDWVPKIESSSAGQSNPPRD